MCSACSGNYEDPDMTAYVPRECLLDGSDCGHNGCPIAEPEPDEALLDVFAYLRAVKRFGLALQQLGRPCDKVGK